MQLWQAPPVCGLAQLEEQVRVLPDLLETARRAHVAGQELLVDRERAGVHVADRVDQAHHPPRAAQVQPGQRLPVGREVEERVAGQHALAARDQPVVELALLRGSGCSSSHTSAPRPDGRSRVIRSCAPNLSAMALNSSSWSTFCRVITTQIFGWPNPASARFSSARIAVS